jgi:colicin import membrane protein
MKKKYIYMLVPLCGVILFCLFYIPFARSYDEKLAQKHKQELKEQEDKATAEAEARRQASIEANLNAEKRRAEREAKAAREKAEKDALDAADAARVKAHNDKQKYEEEVAELTKEIKLEQDALTDLQTTKEDALKEQDFLKSYVQQAEANRQSIQSLLDKLAAAEKARADEDAARKAAAATNS